MSNLLTRIELYKRYTPAKRRSESNDIYNTLLRSGTPELAHAFAMSIALAQGAGNNTIGEDITQNSSLLTEQANKTITALSELYKFHAIDPIVSDDLLTITGSTSSSATAHAIIKQLPEHYALTLDVKTLQGKLVVDSAERTNGEAHTHKLKQILSMYQSQPYQYHLTISLDPVSILGL